MADPVILWLRQDLRLSDQPALVAATHDGPVIPVYVLDDDGPGKWRMGGAQRWYLHHALTAYGEALAGKDSRLILRRGPAAEVLKKLAEETGATRIHAIRHYEPWWREAEAALGDLLCLHSGNHLWPIEEVTTGSGDQYKRYSSFWKALRQKLPPDEPVYAPRKIDAPSSWPDSDALDDWGLLPTGLDWSTGFSEWEAGEGAAKRRLERFRDHVDDYEEDRNLPSEEGSSRLSPHLHFGEVSPRTVWSRLDGQGEGVRSFRSEIGWRDFTDGLILELPDYADVNGRDKYDKLDWRDDDEAKADLKRWQQGKTGYPIVDAGMRQLWQSGWMHNRVRMITASFLTKHLLIDWREGEAWFWDCLVDADYGNNSVNWQWVAGTGVDANMFSRIMAPLTQSEKFAAGDYIRRWVPELADLDDEAIHDPEAAGCRPDDYPEKIISHKAGRERALEAGRKIR